MTPPNRIADLRLAPDDIDCSWGQGAIVQGPATAMIPAIAGRPAALDDLRGDGVAPLRVRLIQR